MLPDFPVNDTTNDALDDSELLRELAVAAVKTPAVPAPAAPPAEADTEKMTIEGHEMAKIEITKEKAK